jgi:tetratricopeptide (TPR) repeat protein
MRCWARLVRWAEDDRRAASHYLRISHAARWHEEGTGGLLRDPELEIGLRWRQANKPTSAWAQRLDPNFDQAIAFLDRSERQRDRERAELRRVRVRRLVMAWSVAGVLAVLLVITAGLALYAFRLRTHARERFEVARNAVNAMVDSAGSEAVRVAAEVPQVDAFRRGLLEKAGDLYTKLSVHRLQDPALRKDIITAHVRLGDIYWLLDDTDKALAEYQTAIDEFNGLGDDSSGIRELTADAYNRLGELQRSLPARHSDAEKSYGQAITLFDSLRRQDGSNGRYQLKLARTLDNRGILYAENNRLEEARRDYAEARRLLDGLPSSVEEHQQESARVYNNSGLLFRRLNEFAIAREQFERAIALGESLTRSKPDTWDYKLELAQFHQNLAILLYELKQEDMAWKAGRQALTLFDELARPAPSMQIHLAKTHGILARVLESQDLIHGADAEYEQSLELFRSLRSIPKAVHFQVWFGNALFDHALFKRKTGDREGAIRLLVEAVQQHEAARANTYLGWDYYYLAKTHLEAGQISHARQYFEKLSALIPNIPEVDRRALEEQTAQLSQSSRSSFERAQ